MFTADKKIKTVRTIRNDIKMMVISAGDLIVKEAHYHVTWYQILRDLISLTKRGSRYTKRNAMATTTIASYS